MGKLSDSNDHAKFLPIPPPLPHPYAESIHHRRSRATRKQWRPYAASNHRMDHLFDEGYRADVAISTDDGGVVYAHASVLVSRLFIRFVRCRDPCTDDVRLVY